MMMILYILLTLKIYEQFSDKSGKPYDRQEQTMMILTR